MTMGPGERAVTRRRFIVATGAAVAGMAAPGIGRGGGAAAAAAPAVVTVRVPRLTENGAKVPIVVEAAHAMEPGHHVATVEVVNPRDPIPSKGVFTFTPANGHAYLAFQARLHHGPSTLHATARCSRDHRWSGSADIRVAEGGGGCAGVAAPPAAGDDILPPRIRIPRLYAERPESPMSTIHGERLARGEVVDVTVSLRHPVRTGLEQRDGAWVQVAPPFYLTTMEVLLGEARVSHFAMTPAVSDNPFITFRLRPLEDGTLRVVFRNNRGARLEAEHPIRLS
jgi:predicted secreted protein